jgi:hypothetical protein
MVLCHYQKNFIKGIKNIRHDLLHNEYPLEFVDTVNKPLRRNRPFSVTIYQDTVIIPYTHIKGISERSRHIGNYVHVRTIFKTNM